MKIPAKPVSLEACERALVFYRGWTVAEASAASWTWALDYADARSVAVVYFASAPGRCSVPFPRCYRRRKIRAFA